jgi:hypothetical protein
MTVFSSNLNKSTKVLLLVPSLLAVNCCSTLLGESCQRLACAKYSIFMPLLSCCQCFAAKTLRVFLNLNITELVVEHNCYRISSVFLLLLAYLAWVILSSVINIYPLKLRISLSSEIIGE